MGMYNRMQWTDRGILSGCDDACDTDGASE